MQHENHVETGNNTADSGTELVPTLRLLPIRDAGLRQLFNNAHECWLMKSPSLDTRRNYYRDVGQFIQFVGSPPEHLEILATVLPRDVAAWRDDLRDRGLTNSSI